MTICFISSQTGNIELLENKLSSQVLIASPSDTLVNRPSISNLSQPNFELIILSQLTNVKRFLVANPLEGSWDNKPSELIRWCINGECEI